MITELGFLEPNLSIRKLKHVYDSTEEISESTDSEEEICKTDTIIYAISNTSDLCTIQFHIKNDNDFYIHHDIITIDTITTAAYKDKKLYTAGFENKINTYNVFDFNPTEPHSSFGEHTDIINKIRLKKNLFSCSDDKTIKEYDLETEKVVNTTNYDYIVRDFFFYDDTFITLDENSIYGEKKLFTNNAEITCASLKGDFVYFGDSEGYFRKLDITKRRIEKEVKISDSSIFSFDMHNDIVYAVSANKLVTLFSDGSIGNKEYDNELSSIAINSDNYMCVIGDEKDNLSIVEL